MVSSLFCARHLLDGSRDLLICYGDIVYQRTVLAALLAVDAPIAVAVDRGWRDLFALTKPRGMSLVGFTALCGLLAAPGSVHPCL